MVFLSWLCSISVISLVAFSLEGTGNVFMSGYHSVTDQRMQDERSRLCQLWINGLHRMVTSQ